MQFNANVQIYAGALSHISWYEHGRHAARQKVLSKTTSKAKNLNLTCQPYLFA